MWQLALKFLNSGRWTWLTTPAVVFQATETVQKNKTTVSTKPNLFINNGGNMKI